MVTLNPNPSHNDICLYQFFYPHIWFVCFFYDVIFILFVKFVLVFEMHFNSPFCFLVLFEL